MLKKYNSLLVLTILVWVSKINAQEVPYVNPLKELNFGQVMGLPGNCHMAYDTGEITSVSGQLCPFSDIPKGQPGELLLVGHPNTTVRIRISQRNPNSDYITFIPDGIFKVFNLPDTNILVNQYQDIATGSSGVIKIIVGGTLSISSPLNFNSEYKLKIIDGIYFEELP